MFEVGEKIICVDNEDRRDLVLFNTYTIAHATNSNVTLLELPKSGFFASSRFIKEKQAYKAKYVGGSLFDETTTQIVDEKTGGSKGQKLARYDLIPGEALAELATVYGKGASKYAERNWEKGYKWTLSFAAMMRHAWRWMLGEDNDPETGVHHMACVAFHAFAIMTFKARNVGEDDRPSSAR